MESAGSRSRRHKAQPRAAKTTSSRALRTRSATISYAEDSDLDSERAPEEFEPDSSEDDDAIFAAPRRSNRNQPQRQVASKRRRAHIARPEDSAEESDYRYHSTKKRRKSARGTSIPTATKHKLVDSDIAQSNGVIPDWQGQVAYEIWAQIFRYSFTPLYDQTFQPLQSVQQLLGVAKLCKAFASPALKILYESPPLVPMLRAHLFTSLIMSDPESLKSASSWSKELQRNYRPWVKSLQIDVYQVAEYTLSGNGHLDLYGLIKDLPKLTELELYHPYDMAPYRELDRKIRWQHPETIFDALEHIDASATGARAKTTIRTLDSWRWSSRLAGTKYPLDSIQGIHLRPSFASLKKVAFVNYQVPVVKKDEVDPKHEVVLADAINALKQLKHLSFESSSLVNWKLFPLLPKTLRHLELINCWDVNADDLASFLLTHGCHLRSLTLNHNKSLSLAFLPVLTEGCPKLEALRMNLTYFNVHSTYHDSEPEYEHLLLPEQIPTWPSTLQTIELAQLRKWERPAAEVFFQSLVNSAGALPDLRRLVIQAILNIGWQERALLRKKWTAVVDRVFKRVSDPPKPVATVVKQSTQHPQEFKDLQESDIIENNTSASALARKSLRSNSSIPLTITAIGGNLINILAPTASKNLGESSKKYLKPKPQEPSPPANRTRSARSSKPISYAESPEPSDHESEFEDEDEEPIRAPTRRSGSSKRRGRLSYEVEALTQNAKHFISSGPSGPSTPNTHTDTESDIEMDWAKARKGEVVQGMCDVVDLRIDNMRPAENLLTEADFLDDERSGDDSWDEDAETEDEGQAW